MPNSPSYLCGFDMGSVHEAHSVTGAPTISATAHSGGGALRCNPTGAQAFVAFRSVAAGGTARSLFGGLRFWLRIDSLPAANCLIVVCFSTTVGANRQYLKLNTNGTLTVGSVSTDAATSTLAMTADATWHQILFDAGYTGGTDGVRVYVDGVLFVNADSGLTVTSGGEGQVGVITSTTADLYFDDLVWYTAIGVDDGWGSYNVALLNPDADSARGNWTGGAGGTASLFNALDNEPPVGLTAGSDSDTSQIQNAVSATYPATAAQRGDFKMQSYATAGIVASDTVLAVQAICNHGEGIATGTKIGGVFIVSNPAQGTLGDWFDYGNDIGAIGTWPFTTAGTPTRGWFTAGATPVANPAVTLATQPVVGVFKDTASTRESHVAFLGIYVAYSPGLPPELMGRPDGLHGQQQMHQLLSQ